MEQNLLDRMVETYQKNGTMLTITLQNGTKIHGTIEMFDSYIIIMKNEKSDILYRHAISSISPSLSNAQNSPKETAPQRLSSQSASKATHIQTAPASRGPKTERRRNHIQSDRGEYLAKEGICLNSGMKDGLLKWMQMQKDSKQR